VSPTTNSSINFSVSPIVTDELFFEIPREGEVNSHTYILNREAEYLGVTFAEDVDVQALLQEITDLRQQLLDAETENANLIQQSANNGI
jgi:hypothetical protein